MELQTISQITRSYGVSTRMMRYYEQIGMLKSLKKEDYAYRVYDEAAVLALEQILLLRKLRVPLKQIAELLKNQDAAQAVKVFLQQVSEINDEITALSTIRAILVDFIDLLQKHATVRLPSLILNENSLLKLIGSLSLKKNSLREEIPMYELNDANEKLSVLKNVRIVNLPPCTVAASHYIGESPEEHAGDLLCDFLKSSKLYQRKPDARVFGFNHPNPSPDKPVYGYELWVTIPDDLEVPEPLVKKRFEGGMYAAHMIVLGDFHEWKQLDKWVNVGNAKYEPNDIDDGGECMHGLLEEHLNYVYHANLNWPESDEHQLDLLFPVKLKTAQE